MKVLVGHAALFHVHCSEPDGQDQSGYVFEGSNVSLIVTLGMFEPPNTYPDVPMFDPGSYAPRVTDESDSPGARVVEEAAQIWLAFDRIA